jgi:1-aminocyclopropane-1-carboxylate deaminase
MPTGNTSPRIADLVIPPDAAVSVLSDALFSDKKVSVQLLRLDQIDPVLSGNKAFKLIPNLVLARVAGFDTVLSFGGAYSNHIHALAEAGQRFKFKTIGVIRGDDGQADSHTLQFASSRGMKLVRVSRQDYKRRDDAHFLSNLSATLGDFYLIPEGGANEVGMRGSMQLASVIKHSLFQDWPDEIVLACGTGTTMAGLIAGLGQHGCQCAVSCVGNLPMVRGIAVLKQGDFLRRNVLCHLQNLQAPACCAVKWQIETRYHCGGYAKCPAELISFMQDFERKHNILLDPVYTAKLMSAVYQRIAADLYEPGTRLLLIHTGGLQGRIPQPS